MKNEYTEYSFESTCFGEIPEVTKGSNTSGNCSDLVHFLRPNVKLKKLYPEKVSYTFSKKTFFIL